jgi:hypothetical protein
VLRVTDIGDRMKNIPKCGTPHPNTESRLNFFTSPCKICWSENKIDLHDSITCPWNDPVNSILNFLPGGQQYRDVTRQATIPIYQPSTLLPLQCFNSDTTAVHISLDQLSFQFGTSSVRDIKTAKYYGDDSYANYPFTLGYVQGSIPNQTNNTTRLFYANLNANISFTKGIPNLDDVIKSSQSPVVYSTISSIRAFDPGTILPTSGANLQDAPGFPFQSIKFDYLTARGYPDTQDPTPRDPVWQNPADYSNLDYFQLVDSAPMNITCPNDSLSALVPGCNQPGGCVFGLSVSQCYGNTSTSLSSINQSKNLFFLSGGSNTGCGVVRTECYKIGANPFYKPYCCRDSFTSDMLDPSSLTLNSSLLNNNVGFVGTPGAHSYSARTMYCDPSWISGGQCDVDLQDYCSTLTSTRDFGSGVKTIHAVLDGAHPCGQWYAGLMNEYATYLFTQRNTQIIGNMFVQYCGNGAGVTAQNVGDTQSCACIKSFNANGLYYTPDTNPGSQSKGFPVVGTGSQTDQTILYTDPVCGSIMCPTDPNFFTYPTPTSTLSTVVLPEIVLQKRHCPQDICASVLGDVSIDISNFSGGTEIDIGNFTNSCYISSGGSSVTRTITTQYTFDVQALDDLPPLCGRWQYDVQNGSQIINQGGAAGFNLMFQVYATDPTQEVIDIGYTLTGYTSTYFEFLTTQSTFTAINDGSSALLQLQVHPFGLLPSLDYAQGGLVIDRGQVTMTSQIMGGTATQKIWPVQILLYPNGDPPAPNSNIIPTRPLPQKPQFSISKGSLALLLLSVLFILYAFGFFTEMIQIRNLVAGVSDLLPKT